jgi:hypothetical protein
VERAEEQRGEEVEQRDDDEEDDERGCSDPRRISTRRGWLAGDSIEHGRTRICPKRVGDLRDRLSHGSLATPIEQRAAYSVGQERAGGSSPNR